MDPALVGLLGTLLGGLTAIGGILIANRLQIQREYKERTRSNKQEAYSQSIRSLLRLINKRSKLTANGTAILGREDVKEWFDDYIETEHWVTQISLYSPKAYKAHQIDDKAKELRSVFYGLIAGTNQVVDLQIKELTDIRHDVGSKNQPSKINIPTLANELLQRVIEAAHDDIGAATSKQ